MPNPLSHVRIFKPAKSTMQSGRGKSDIWAIEPEQFSTARIPDPLMGWVSAGDTETQLLYKLRFDTLDAAVAFANKKGWGFTIDDETQRTVTPRNYLDNFKAKGH